MLDPKGRSEVIKTIKMLNEEKDITVVLITHYMDEAAHYGQNRLLLMTVKLCLTVRRKRYLKMLKN